MKFRVRRQRGKISLNKPSYKLLFFIRRNNFIGMTMRCVRNIKKVQ